MKRTILGLALAALVAASGTAFAQDFPTRPMTMVIPFAAGGPTDLLGRVIAAKMGEILKQNVIVENVGGAGGMTGSARGQSQLRQAFEFTNSYCMPQPEVLVFHAHEKFDAAGRLIDEKTRELLGKYLVALAAWTRHFVR